MFFIRDLKKGWFIVIRGFLDLKDICTSFVTQIDPNINRLLLFLTSRNEFELGMNESNT